MKLRQQMFIGSALLAVIPVAFTVWQVSKKASEMGESSLQGNVQSHITSVRDAKKKEVEDYFNRITDQLVFFSKLPSTIKMMRDFKQAYNDFNYEALSNSGNVEVGPPEPGAVTVVPELPIKEYREALKAYYTGEFKIEYELLNSDAMPNMLEYIDQLPDTSVAMQYFYIADNPNPLGTKEEFLIANDNSSYSQIHRAYHPIIFDFMSRFKFYDIYFVDSENGNVVYSVLKNIDFASSLIDGPLVSQQIANVFMGVRDAITTEDYKLVDYAKYLPAYENRIAFMATPIFDGNQKEGVLILALTLEPINDLMTYDRSWRKDESGDTGETLIIAADGTMRNDSRPFVENREKFIVAMEEANLVEQKSIDNIELKDTTAGLLKVESPGTRSALSGVTGFDIFENYMGIDVLSAYAPVNVPGLNWAIFSELNERESFKQLDALTAGIQDASYPIGLTVLIVGGLFGFFFFGRIAGRISYLEHTMNKVAEGDFTARADIRTKDELGTLSKAFNALLDDRLTQLAKIEKENEMLNNSIIELLKASFQLSQRDLTVQVPVTEDVTGPLADAINQMAQETSKVLLNVKKISEDVDHASRQVKAQADNVTKTAENERTIVATTLSELGAAAEAMNKIAEVAQSCNEIAAEATRTTQVALETVTGTVNGMGEIRETIHETEKRIKRLGERSQEISGIVDIINNIAERTHVLALNASMQAAAAGEAGRGFSVVADEVQRLAESSRNATSQISALVKNIQVETNDTIATMDKTIQQVVEGSQLAERAGQQMKETQDTTANLVKVVEQIAMASQQQARISNELREHAMSIQTSTEETGRQLEEQTVQTDRLADYSNMLMDSIGQFKLPGD